jgi:hypothetical protein
MSFLIQKDILDLFNGIAVYFRILLFLKRTLIFEKFYA